MGVCIACGIMAVYVEHLDGEDWSCELMSVGQDLYLKQSGCEETQRSALVALKPLCHSQW